MAPKDWINITTAFGIEFIWFRVHLLPLGLDRVFRFCFGVAVTRTKAIHSPKLLGFSLSDLF